MDSEKMFSLLEKIYIEVQNTNGRLDNLENRFDNLERRFDVLEQRVSSVEVKIDNNTMLLEKTQHHVKLLAEGHVSIVERMDSQFSELTTTIENNYSLHDAAIKELAKSSYKGEKAYNFIENLTKATFSK